MFHRHIEVFELPGKLFSFYQKAAEALRDINLSSLKTGATDSWAFFKRINGLSSEFIERNIKLLKQLGNQSVALLD